jgi:hypothetical protein
MLIDKLIERAFCDGYEYAQREYSKKKNEEYNPPPEVVISGTMAGIGISKSWDAARKMGLSRKHSAIAAGTAGLIDGAAGYLGTKGGIYIADKIDESKKKKDKKKKGK